MLAILFRPHCGNKVNVSRAPFHRYIAVNFVVSSDLFFVKPDKYKVNTFCYIGKLINIFLKARFRIIQEQKKKKKIAH